MASELPAFNWLVGTPPRLSRTRLEIEKTLPTSCGAHSDQ